MLHSRSQLLLFMKKRQRTLRPGEKFSTASMLTTPGPFTGSCFRAYLPASSALILLTAVLPERKSNLGHRSPIFGTQLSPCFPCGSICLKQWLFRPIVAWCEAFTAGVAAIHPVPSVQVCKHKHETNLQMRHHGRAGP